MAIKAGVWIDHHRAVVVLITDNEEEIRQIKSNVDKPFASAGGPGSKHPDRPQGFIAEDTQEHKFMNQLNTYYDEVRTSLRDADSILILGPGEAKGEFQKRLKSKKFPAHVVDLKTADKMTDRQIAASVRQHFVLVHGQD
jgi:stalled ribosome rescue protein Dom34